MEQQYNNMYYDEDEVDLKELLIWVLRRWRGIILCALIFAILGGAFKGITGLAKLHDAEYMESQRKTVEEDQEQYDTQKELYETQLKNLENEIRTLNDYREKSIYMNIDPFNEYHETVTYYISTDYQIMPGMDYQNLNPTTSILNAYIRRVQDFNIYGGTLNLIDNAITVSDIKELVQVQQDNTNSMFTVTIVGPDEKIPQILMDTVRKTVEDSKKDIEQSIGKHNVNEVMANSGYTVDTVLSDNKIRFEDNMTKLHDALVKKQKAIDDLKEPSGEVLSKKGVVKQAVKFGLMGLIGGGFISTLWVCAIFLLSDRMPGESELKEKYGIRIIGRYRREEKKGSFSFVDRWIGGLEGIRKVDYDRECVIQLAAANLEGIVPKGSSIAVIGAIDKEQLHMLCDRLKKYVGEYAILEAGNITEESEALRKLIAIDGVVFVESVDNTKRSEFLRALETVQEQKKEVYGLILI